jgi:Protein of unknown function (DUF2510)
VEMGSVAKPGWYPNPSDGKQLRYWDGHRWTSRTADADESSSFWKRHRTFVRRVLWTLYTVLFVFALLTASTTWDWGNARPYVSALVYAAAVVALVLHTWDRRTLSTSFWKAFAFGFVGYLTALTLSTPVEGGMFPWSAVTLFIPLYVALFRYAYRTWPE